MEEVEGPGGGESPGTAVSQTEAELCPGLMSEDQLAALVAPAAELEGLTVTVARLSHHQQAVLGEQRVEPARRVELGAEREGALGLPGLHVVEPPLQLRVGVPQ